MFEPEGHKTCSVCNVIKPLSEFYPAKNCRLGVRSECSACSRSDVDKKSDTRYRKKYGISLDQVQKLLAQQGGVCAICKCQPAKDNTITTLERFAVDHDHQTGVIRGILCNWCNLGLGHLDDSVDRLLSAIAYLQSIPPTIPAPDRPSRKHKVKPLTRVQRIRRAMAGGGGPVIDHLGNVFDTQAAAARYYKIDQHSVRHILDGKRSSCGVVFRSPTLEEMNILLEESELPTQS